MSVYVFSSPTCVPCNNIKPIIEDLKEEFSTLSWNSVNIQNDPQGLAQKYNITVVPTIVVESRAGIERHSGSVIAQYYRILRNAVRSS